MHSSVFKAFIPFSTQFEGRIPHMYLDIKGLVTIGIGNLIDPLTENLPFVHEDSGAPATPEEIKEEWKFIKSHKELAQKGYKAAGKLTKLYLRNDDIDHLVLTKLHQFELILKKYFPNFESWPADAQLATLSMAWAMGPDFPSPNARVPWPKFTAHCREQSWSKAANECRMKESDNPGVIKRNDANVACFKYAAVVKACKLPYDVLHFGNTTPINIS